MRYPLTLRFKVLAIATQIYVTDAAGDTVFYVKQKLFKLKEDIRVFGDEDQARERFSIRADRVIDFSASYAFTDAAGRPLGAIKRQGMRSFWKSHYEIRDAAGDLRLTLTEERPWVKVLDTLLDQVPVVGLMTGYFLNPSFVFTLPNGEVPMRLTKRPSLLERRFEIEKVGAIDADDETRAILGALMMVLLERQRG